jgi:hypothetical protein
MQKISDKYLNQTLTIEPGNRLHRLVAMLIDTWYDDLTDERIADLEGRVEAFRWMNSNAERVDGL